MKESPILFSTPMVQAHLQGRKTQTRRLVTGTALQWLNDFTPQFVADPDNKLCKYGYPGDLMWCRETFVLSMRYGVEMSDGDYYAYKADCPELDDWMPSIFMPKAAARLWFQLEEVRLERLNDISEEDAIAEGIEKMEDPFGDGFFYKDYTIPHDGFLFTRSFSNPIESYKSLWNSINDFRKVPFVNPITTISWKANPWVWVLKYKTLSTTGRP